MLLLDVERLRDNHRVSQVALCDYLGIFPATLSSMIHGRIDVTDPVEHGVAEVLANPFAIAALTMPKGEHEDDGGKTDFVNAKRLNAFMRNYNFSQTQVAERSGVSAPAVNCWVHGSRPINQDAMRWVINFEGDPWDVKLDPGDACPPLKFLRAYGISQERFANMNNERDLWGLRDFDQEALLALVRNERHNEAVDAILLATAALRFWREHPDRVYHQQYLDARVAAEDAVAFGRHFDAAEPLTSGARKQRRMIDGLIVKATDARTAIPAMQEVLDLLDKIRLAL
jgi:transcriptional regulator with XRE-family HTH domain